jgi:hypothetical protein
MRNLKFICSVAGALLLAIASTVLAGERIGDLEEFFRRHGWTYELVPPIVPAVFIEVLCIGGFVVVLAYAILSWDFGDQDRGL